MERLLNTIDGLIEQQGIQQEATRKDLVGIVHRLIDANQNAVRYAVHPIGKTCGSLQVGDAEAEAPIIDLATVDSIRAEGELDGFGAVASFFTDRNGEVHDDRADRCLPGNRQTCRCA